MNTAWRNGVCGQEVVANLDNDYAIRVERRADQIRKDAGHSSQTQFFSNDRTTRTDKEAGCSTVQVSHGWKHKKGLGQRYLSTEGTVKHMPVEHAQNERRK